jgi:hypothetical protein
VIEIEFTPHDLAVYVTALAANTEGDPDMATVRLTQGEAATGILALTLAAAAEEGAMNACRCAPRCATCRRRARHMADCDRLTERLALVVGGAAAAG